MHNVKPGDETPVFKKEDRTKKDKVFEDVDTIIFLRISSGFELTFQSFIVKNYLLNIYLFKRHQKGHYD